MKTGVSPRPRLAVGLCLSSAAILGADAWVGTWARGAWADVAVSGLVVGIVVGVMAGVLTLGWEAWPSWAIRIVAGLELLLGAFVAWFAWVFQDFS